MNARLHHFAYNIRPDALELVLELFEKLGCSISYRQEGARWCMVEQKPIPVDIQIIETNDVPVVLDKKKNTHIAFLSDSPEKIVEDIRQWCETKEIQFKQGGWTEKEIWFDLPEVFINFVVEIMHTSVVE